MSDLTGLCARQRTLSCQASQLRSDGAFDLRLVSALLAERPKKEIHKLPKREEIMRASVDTLQHDDLGNTSAKITVADLYRAAWASSLGSALECTILLFIAWRRP